jgi:hypothetical protein
MNCIQGCKQLMAHPLERLERGDAIFHLDNLEPGGIESLPMEKALHLVVSDEQHDGGGTLIIHLVSGDLWQAV